VKDTGSEDGVGGAEAWLEGVVLGKAARQGECTQIEVVVVEVLGVCMSLVEHCQVVGEEKPRIV
jgi:hypothetical protein